jgi:hypothetical protein
VGEEEEYTLEKSFTERNTSFGGQNSRSPEVAVAMEREGGEKRKKKLDQTYYAPKGTSEDGTLLSTVVQAGLPHLQTKAPTRVTPPVHQRMPATLPLYS